MSHISDTRPYFGYTAEHLIASRDNWLDAGGRDSGASVLTQINAELAHRKEEDHAEATAWIENNALNNAARQAADRQREAQYAVYTQLVEHYMNQRQASDISAWASAKHDLITIGASRELVESFRQRMVAANRRRMNAQADAVKAADRDYAADVAESFTQKDAAYPAVSDFLSEYH